MCVNNFQYNAIYVSKIMQNSKMCSITYPFSFRLTLGQPNSTLIASKEDSKQAHEIIL